MSGGTQNRLPPALFLHFPMLLQTISAGPFGTNLYLITDDSRTHCAIVDAPPGAAELLLSYLKKNGLTLDAILITHGHWDHNGGVAGVLAGTNPELPVFAHEDGRDFHEKPEKFSPWYQAAIPGLSAADFPAFKLSRPTTDGETFTLLGKTWQALFVPGHCPGSLAFYCPEEKWLFTGDALFAGSIGRTDLPGGSFPVLEKSICEKIFPLPGDVRVFPGHGPATTVGEERESNPYVRA